MLMLLEAMLPRWTVPAFSERWICSSPPSCPLGNTFISIAPPARSLTFFASSSQ